MISIILLSCILVFLVNLINGIQLQVDRQDACVAYGNGTVYNVSSLNWPFVFHDTRNYTYTLASPCQPNLQCPGYEGTEVILCQEDHNTPDIYYNGGEAKNAVWTVTNMWGWDPTTWSILFFNGNDWRMTNVTFIVNTSIQEPEITFISEYPYLQYDILITGACIGQPWPCNNNNLPDGLVKENIYF